MKKLTKLLCAGLAAFALSFSVGLTLKSNEKVQEIHATGESVGTPATFDQVIVNGSKPTASLGVTFEDGLLTIPETFYSTDLIVIVDQNCENVDLTVVVYKNPVNAIFYNKNGNLTVETYSNIQVQQAVVGGNLTIKGSGFFRTLHMDGMLPLGGHSIIHVGEKFIVEDEAFIGGTVLNTSLRCALSAKSIEINTEDKFEFGCNTTNPSSGSNRAAVLIHDCANVNELANRLIIKRGKVSLNKYYEKDSEYNVRFGFVAWTQNDSGYIGSSNYDTDNILFTGYPLTVSDTDLNVKARRVDLEKNGGLGDYVSLGYYVIGSVVTLPECPYLAPSGQRFKGWALESTSATPLKQPGDTFTFGEGTDPTDWKNEYFNVYPIWEDDPEALTGTVTLTGSLKYGETLTASVTNTKDAGVLSYQWRRNGDDIASATSSTYVVSEDDITRTLSVMVTSSVKTSYLLATASGKIDKADGPNAPTGITATACTNEYNSNGIISGVTVGMEFKPSDSETWYSVGSPSITSLPSGTYNVRYKETTTHKAGQIANVVVNAYNAPTLYGVTVNNGSADSVAVTAGTTITITANAPEEGYEFDKWVSSDVTFADANSTSTTFVMPEANVTVTATYKPTVVPPALTGTVSIVGSLKYGKTLTASVTDTNNTGTLSYQWRRNGDDIASATSSTYVVGEDDIGYTLSVKVSSSIETGFIVGTASGVITKADGPNAPTGISAVACTTEANNDGVLKGVTTEMEYKLSTSSEWVDGTGSDITNLVAGTYNVRVKATSTHEAGEIANVVIDAYNVPTPSSSGLSGGAIAGIIIASILVAGIGGFALVWFVIKKKTWEDFVKIFKKK